MKYLKYFESIDSSIVKEFKELTKNYLAYLIDDGLKFNIGKEPKYRLSRISKNEKRQHFYIDIQPNSTWEDCKDTIIPYLEVIKSNYNFKDGDKVIELMLEDKNYKFLLSKSLLYYNLDLTIDELLNDYKIITSEGETISLDKYWVLKIGIRIYI